MSVVPWPIQRDASRQVACLTEGVYSVTPFADDSTNFLLYVQNLQQQRGRVREVPVGCEGDFANADWGFMIHVNSLVWCIAGNDIGWLSIISDIFNDESSHIWDPSDINSADLGKVWYSSRSAKLRLTNNVGKEYMFVSWYLMIRVRDTVTRNYPNTILHAKCVSIEAFLDTISRESLQIGTIELLHAEFPGPFPFRGNVDGPIVIEPRTSVELEPNDTELETGIETTQDAPVDALPDGEPQISFERDAQMQDGQTNGEPQTSIERDARMQDGQTSGEPQTSIERDAQMQDGQTSGETQTGIERDAQMQDAQANTKSGNMVGGSDGLQFNSTTRTGNDPFDAFVELDLMDNSGTRVKLHWEMNNCDAQVPSVALTVCNNCNKWTKCSHCNRPKSEYGYVYVMHLAGVGVKIGKSCETEDREKSLNTDRYDTVESTFRLFARFYCFRPLTVEKRLHDLLKGIPRVHIQKELFRIELSTVVDMYFFVRSQRDPETMKIDPELLELPVQLVSKLRVQASGLAKPRVAEEVRVEEPPETHQLSNREIVERFTSGVPAKTIARECGLTARQVRNIASKWKQTAA
eukprot:614362-Rhodomonas_salina.2